jgi:hypothetical protein
MTLPACPRCGQELQAELLVEAVADLAMARPLSERAAHRRAELYADVAAHLATDPTASANAVSRCLAGRRSDVLEAVRTLRGRLELVPEPRNRGSRGAGGRS